MSHSWFEKNAYKALNVAVKQLNVYYPELTTQRGLEECVRFKITQDYINRGLLYKIDDNLPPDVREAIKHAIIKEAEKLRIEVITV